MFSETTVSTPIASVSFFFYLLRSVFSPKPTGWRQNKASWLRPLACCAPSHALPPLSRWAGWTASPMGFSASLCLQVFVSFLQLAGGQLSLHRGELLTALGRMGFQPFIPTPGPLISSSGSCQGQGGARGGGLLKELVGGFWLPEGFGSEASASPSCPVASRTRGFVGNFLLFPRPVPWALIFSVSLSACKLSHTCYWLFISEPKDTQAVFSVIFCLLPQIMVLRGPFTSPLDSLPCHLGESQASQLGWTQGHISHLPFR